MRNFSNILQRTTRLGGFKSGGPGRTVYSHLCHVGIMGPFHYVSPELRKACSWQLAFRTDRFFVRPQKNHPIGWFQIWWPWSDCILPFMPRWHNGPLSLRKPRTAQLLVRGNWRSEPTGSSSDHKKTTQLGGFKSGGPGRTRTDTPRGT